MGGSRSVWQRKLRIIRRIQVPRRKWQLLVLVVGALCLFTCKLLITDQSDIQGYLYDYCTPIDAVYTWVNGSDPKFIEAAKRYDPTYDPARFDDKNELRYSLRSLERFANWIRRVYIVTNGQIPNWLDLSYERVVIVPHEVLAPDPSQLPTFSSAAIETFLHRIPKLSKRFIYLNDDIFLGAPLYPEDLYTEADGVRIYQAWMVPDCATDCPWTYIGDGACDHHCDIAACQYDGGDCSELGPTQPVSQSEELEAETTPLAGKLSVTPIHTFPKQKLPTKQKRNLTNFKEIMRHKNHSTLAELRRIVEKFNRHKLNTQYEIIENNTKRPQQTQTVSKVDYISSTDVYSNSLITTNMLLNRIYGFKARNVLAHVGFLLDRDIINHMQLKFKTEVQATSMQRFRSASDLQFAFAYYSFLMSETEFLSIKQIFDEYDTDGSGTWSDREVRTFLTRIYPTPLDWSAMRYFEEVVTNCTRKLKLDKRNEEIIYSTLVYERYEDSNLPTITFELVANCPLLAEALVSNFAVRPKYKYNINSKRAIHSNFMMLTSNVTEVVNELDKLRRSPRKFNCINDNLDAAHKEENELIRHLLEDFYLSFFPRRSKFELEPQYRNRFTSWHDFQRWRRRKRSALVLGYGLSILLLIVLARFICSHKAKIVRRCIQRL